MVGAEFDERILANVMLSKPIPNRLAALGSSNAGGEAVVNAVTVNEVIPCMYAALASAETLNNSVDPTVPAANEYVKEPLLEANVTSSD